MASISKHGKGRRIRFVDASGKPRNIYLPGATQKQAESVRTKVEHLNNSIRLGSPLDGEVVAWVDELSDEMNGKLAAVGLVTRRETSTIATFIDDYIAGRIDQKPGTRTNLEYCREAIVGHFGGKRGLHDVTRQEAEAFLRQLHGDQYAPATVGRIFRRARELFNVAHKRKLIRSNPFSNITTPQQVNTARAAFIGRDDAARVLEACPGNEWRLIFALSRYMGLRCPSEHFSLKWGNIDWEKSLIHIPSPKTGDRWMPIVPEVRPLLDWAFAMAEEGDEYVLSPASRSHTNLGTQLKRIVARAGLKPWPRIFHNLRASCETELVERYPLHVVSRWLGHSAVIANKHYLQLRDDHFQRAAIHGALGTVEEGKARGQNRGQQAAVLSACTSNVENENREYPAETGYSSKSSLVSKALESGEITPSGFEPEMRVPKTLVLPVTPRGSVVLATLQP